MICPNELSIATATDEYYTLIIAQLERARRQMLAVRAGQTLATCAVCGDPDHTAATCRDNPLLHVVAGRNAMVGAT